MKTKKSLKRLRIRMQAAMFLWLAACIVLGFLAYVFVAACLSVYLYLCNLAPLLEKDFFLSGGNCFSNGTVLWGKYFPDYAVTAT